MEDKIVEEDRVGDKIEEIQEYLEELETTFPVDFKEYMGDFKIRAIWERYFEKIVEAIIDLCFLLIKEKDLRMPEEDERVFDILVNEEMISQELCERMKDAKSMRNIIAHEYGKIDDVLVFHAITEELIKDVELFIKEIKK